jgi:hypothetical protein
MEEGNNRLNSGSSLQRAARGRIELAGFGAISFHPLNSGRSMPLWAQ